MLIAVEGSESGDGIKRPAVADVVVDIEQGATHVSLDAQLLAGFQVCRTVWVAIAKGWVDAMEGSAWIIIVLIIEYHAHGSIIVSPPLGRLPRS